VGKHRALAILSHKFHFYVEPLSSLFSSSSCSQYLGYFKFVCLACLYYSTARIKTSKQNK